MLYEKDKSKTITVRLSEKQYEFLKRTSDTLGVSPSQFIRMVVNSTLSAAEKTETTVIDALKESKGE